MNREALTLQQARAYASLTAAAALTASAGVGVTNGTTAGVVAGLIAAATTVFGAVGSVRLLVTCPKQA